MYVFNTTTGKIFLNVRFLIQVTSNSFQTTSDTNDYFHVQLLCIHNSNIWSCIFKLTIRISRCIYVSTIMTSTEIEKSTPIAKKYRNRLLLL